MWSSIFYITWILSWLCTGLASSSQITICRDNNRSRSLPPKHLCDCSSSQENDIPEDRRNEATSFQCRCTLGNGIERVQLSSKVEIEPRDSVTQPTDFELGFPETTELIKIDDCKIVIFKAETFIPTLKSLEINKAENCEIKEYVPAVDKLIIKGKDVNKTVFTIDEMLGGQLFGDDNQEADILFHNVKFTSESDELFTHLVAKSFIIGSSTFESVLSKDTTTLGEMTLNTSFTIKDSDIQSIFSLGLEKTHNVQFSNNKIHSTCKHNNELNPDGLDNNCFLPQHLLQNETFQGNQIQCSCKQETGCVNADKAVTQYVGSCSDVVLQNTECLDFPGVSLYQLKTQNITHNCQQFEEAVQNMGATTQNTDSCPGCHRETKITKREKELAKIAVNHEHFDKLVTPDKVCEEEIIPEIVKVKTQVVAGTNYIMHLKFVMKHGKNCGQTTEAVCTNVVMHKPLPHECGEDSNNVTGCARLINTEDINCTTTKQGGGQAGERVQHAVLLDSESSMNTGSLFGLVLFLIGSVFLLVLIVLIKRFPPKGEAQNVPKTDESSESKMENQSEDKVETMNSPLGNESNNTKTIEEHK